MLGQVQSNDIMLWGWMRHGCLLEQWLPVPIYTPRYDSLTSCSWVECATDVSQNNGCQSKYVSDINLLFRFVRYKSLVSFQNRLGLYTLTSLGTMAAGPNLHQSRAILQHHALGMNVARMSLRTMAASANLYTEVGVGGSHIMFSSWMCYGSLLEQWLPI